MTCGVEWPSMGWVASIGLARVTVSADLITVRVLGIPKRFRRTDTAFRVAYDTSRPKLPGVLVAKNLTVMILRARDPGALDSLFREYHWL